MEMKATLKECGQPVEDEKNLWQAVQYHIVFMSSGAFEFFAVKREEN